jgi:hypothetical protein
MERPNISLEQNDSGTIKHINSCVGMNISLEYYKSLQFSLSGANVSYNIGLITSTPVQILPCIPYT